MEAGGVRDLAELSESPTRGRGVYLPSCASMYARKSWLMRVWYPFPCFLNHAKTSASTRSVTWHFPDGGLRPSRTTERAKSSADSGGISEKSMSSSFRLSNLDRSVLAAFKKGRFFIFTRLSSRDDVDNSICFRMRDDYDRAVQKTDGDKSRLIIIIAPILQCSGHTVGSRYTIPEVNSVFAEPPTSGAHRPGLIARENGPKPSLNPAGGQLGI